MRKVSQHLSKINDFITQTRDNYPQNKCKGCRYIQTVVYDKIFQVL